MTETIRKEDEKTYTVLLKVKNPLSDEKLKDLEISIQERVNEELKKRLDRAMAKNLGGNNE